MTRIRRGVLELLQRLIYTLFLFKLLVLYFNWNIGKRSRDKREDVEQEAVTEDSELTTSLIDRNNPSSDYRLYNTNGPEYS